MSDPVSIMTAAGDSEEEETRRRRIADEINDLQKHTQRKGDGTPRRALHAKMIAGLTTARFQVVDDLPVDLRSTLLQPGREYEAWVRFSNSANDLASDDRKGAFGMAVRVFYDPPNTNRFQDLLGSNSPTSHARNAEEFMHSVSLLARNKFLGALKLALTPRFLGGVGILRGTRMVWELARQQKRINSVATETYWSRTPFALGPYSVSIKYQLVPDNPPADEGFNGDDRLRHELARRLQNSVVRFRLEVQRYANERVTPIDDATIEWPTPFETAAHITISANASGVLDANLDQQAFSPWNHSLDFKPLGSLNEARKTAYEASVRAR